MIKIEFHCGNEVMKVKAKTISEAFEELNPRTFRAKTILVLRDGEKKAELALYPRVLRKLIANPLSRLLAQKRLTFMLK